MKSNYNNLPAGVRRVFWQSDKKDKKYRAEAKNWLISYDDCIGVYLSDVSDTVEYSLEKELRSRALKKALCSLSDEERRVIDECFFFVGNKRPTYEYLAKKYGISRQAYCKRLNKILAKLRVIIRCYLDDE